MPPKCVKIQTQHGGKGRRERGKSESRNPPRGGGYPNHGAGVTLDRPRIQNRSAKLSHYWFFARIFTRLPATRFHSRVTGVVEQRGGVRVERERVGEDTVQNEKEEKEFE